MKQEVSVYVNKKPAQKDKEIHLEETAISNEKITGWQNNEDSWEWNVNPIFFIMKTMALYNPTLRL